MLENISVRQQREKVKFELQGDDIALVDELVEWMQDQGLDHADRDIAVEAVLRSFCDRRFSDWREFEEWREKRQTEG